MPVFHFTFVSFECEINVNHEYLSIVWPFRNLIVNAEKIVKISHKPMNTPMHDGKLYTYLYIFYLNENDKLVKRTYSVPVDDPYTEEFFQSLRETYPHADYLGPHEHEKEQILSRTNRYSLEKTYPLSIHIILLFVSSLMLIMDTQYPQYDENIRYILSGINLYCLLWFGLLIGRRIYAVKTDDKGITVRKFFIRKFYPWEQCNVKFIRRQHLRNKKQQASIISYSEVNFTKNRKTTTSRLTITSCARLFRELYYRNMVSFEMAKKALGFL